MEDCRNTHRLSCRRSLGSGALEPHLLLTPLTSPRELLLLVTNIQKLDFPEKPKLAVNNGPILEGHQQPSHEPQVLAMAKQMVPGIIASCTLKRVPQLHSFPNLYVCLSMQASIYNGNETVGQKLETVPERGCSSRLEWKRFPNAFIIYLTLPRVKETETGKYEGKLVKKKKTHGQEAILCHSPESTSLQGSPLSTQLKRGSPNGMPGFTLLQGHCRDNDNLCFVTLPECN